MGGQNSYLILSAKVVKIIDICKFIFCRESAKNGISGIWHDSCNRAHRLQRSLTFEEIKIQKNSRLILCRILPKEKIRAETCVPALKYAW